MRFESHLASCALISCFCIALAFPCAAQTVVNPSFEDSGGSLDGWTQEGPNNFGMDGNFPNPGPHTGSHWATLSVGGGGTGALYQEVAVVPHATYGLSAHFFYGGDNGTYTINMGIGYMDGPYSLGSEIILDSTSYANPSGTWFMSGWREMGGTFVPTSNTATLYLPVSMAGWSAGGHIDSVTLAVIGSLPTPTPAASVETWNVYR